MDVKRDRVIQVYFTDGEYGECKKFAKDEGLTISAFCRMLTLNFIKNKKKEDK